MANCVKWRFSLNLQLFSVVLKSAPVKYMATYCPWDLHQIHSSCTSMSLWWQNNPSLWLSWTVSIPKWVSILWHAACAPSDAKLLEGGVCVTHLQVNSLRPRPNRRHFADDIFKCIFENENEWISPRISLKFVPKVQINNIPALVQIMAWRRAGDKPLSEPMMVSLLTHICVTRPQWVNHRNFSMMLFLL